MSVTLTPNYSLIKPLVGTEVDLWGVYPNMNMDIIDTQLKVNSDDITDLIHSFIYPVATVIDLQALTTTVYSGSQILLASYNAGTLVGGGLFEDRTATYSFGADGGVCIVDASGRKWVRNDITNITPYMFGAVADGVYDAGISGFNGTDDTPAFIAALAYCNTHNVALRVPSGNYRIARVAGLTNVFDIPFPDGANWTIEGEGYSSALLLDEDIATDHPSNALIGGLGTTGTLRITGIRFQGLWTPHPLAHSATDVTQVRGTRFISFLNGITSYSIYQCWFLDCRWNAIMCNKAQNGKFINNTIQRTAAGGFRSIDANNVICTDNLIEETDDDAIHLHSNNEAGEGFPIRTRQIVTDNIVNKSEGISVLGGHTITVSNNHLFLCKGTGLCVGAYTTQEGAGSTGQVTIANNIIKDNMARYDGGVWATQTLQNGAIVVGGSPVTATAGVFPDAYNAGVYNPPYAKIDSAAPWGAMNIIDWLNEGGDTAIYASAGSRNYIIKGNQVIRTLPSGPYADWGFGNYMARNGYSNPTVSDANWSIASLSLWSDMYNALICDNIFNSCPEVGIYFYVNPASVLGDRQFGGIVIRGNLITNCRFQGISQGRRNSNASPFYSWGVTVENNIFDIDPNFLSSLRVIPFNGKWTQQTGSFDTRQDAINLRGVRGCIIRNNMFRNCYGLIVGNADFYSQFVVNDNIVDCNPVAEVWNANNVGVAQPELAGKAFTHRIYDMNPQSATYRQLLNICPLQADTMPTTGTFVQGHFVQNNQITVVSGTKRLDGWKRATTGTAHVLGTDWLSYYTA